MSKEFAVLLKELLTNKGISNYKLAKDLHISRTTIANYLNGKSEPNDLILDAIHKYFNIKADELPGKKRTGSLEVDSNTYDLISKITTEATSKVLKKLYETGEVFPKELMFKVMEENFEYKKKIQELEQKLKEQTDNKPDK